MKKYFSLCIVIIMLISMNGCSKNSTTDIENTTFDEAYTQFEEFTNPGEYLKSLCSKVKIDNTEFSLPCTFEKMSELFTLTYKDESLSLEGYTTKTYEVFTLEDKYFGIITFVDYDESNDESWLLFNDYRKKDISNNDKTNFIISDFTSGKTKLSEIVAKLGVGYVIDPSMEKGRLYIFEDGTLAIVYEDDTAIEFHICFDIKK